MGLISWRRKDLPIKRLASVEAEVMEINRLLVKADEQLKALRMQHEKLSGRFYSRFGAGDVPTQPDNVRPMSRDELRRAAGIRAGQPAPHK